MTVDYTNAIDMINSDPTYVFVDTLLSVPDADLSIVIHKTASGGPTTATAIAQYFHNNSGRVSAHFVVGKDGSVIQVVRLKDGAGANCCTSSGYNQAYWGPLLSKYGNLNLCTISIEHEDWTTDNSDPMPQAQVDASHRLVLWLCGRYNLSTDQIHSHASIDPVNRSRCPGSTYDFNQLFQYVQSGGNMAKSIAQAAQDTWNSTAFLFGGSPLPYNTGIAASWKSIYLSAKNMPAPTTREFSSVDWNGNAVVVQMFSTIRCEWNGQAHWYNADGGIS
jgi:N-acetyl-anhydromuramyl-L-alanine amidase AmpD